MTETGSKDDGSGASEVEARRFADDGETVNHPDFPLLVMRATPAARASDAAAWFEERFAQNGWGASWRWRVYPFHHFHTTNHEVLGVSRGEAELTLGGTSGERFHVRTGDVIVIPAGVGHCSESHSSDFEVVGAYPEGRSPDLVRSGESDASTHRAAVAAVPVPECDPVFGESGPVRQHWRRTSS